ncbi:MAG: DEAD/DEAH box helicase [Hyphomicrobiaceae bacterium]|nr:DEAD/DEAH box helicase [Hyphomicrobiaceae bacterium]
MNNFTELGLAAPILKALETLGYVTPTPIQAQSIPPVMAGRDLLGIAQTGTGKTAAFALPIIDRLARTTGPRKPGTTRALILSPTRELASQIADNIREYARNTGLTVTTVFGGVGHRPQMQALARGVDILVATPGRLLDHMGERNVRFDATEVFVLDEADQMLDLGFLPAIRRIVANLPKVRQNLFFSATMPTDIGKLASDLLKDPVRVAVTPVATTVERVTQRVIHVESHKKKALLAELFANPELARTLVFTRTKRGADRVARYLEGAGVGVAAIHGNKSQGQREKALEAFKSARIRALVATDIAARGIDVDDVSHVVNYELPDVPESYVHRIGRTARAGRSGIAISFCDPEERAQLRDIERLTRQSIAAEDRRNDTTLAREEKGPREAGSGRPEGQRQGRGQAGHRSGRPGGSRHGHNGRPQGSSGQGRNPERRERDADRRPAQAAPQAAQSAAAGRPDARPANRPHHRPDQRQDRQQDQRPAHRTEQRPEQRSEQRPDHRPDRRPAPAGQRSGPRPDGGGKHRTEGRGHGSDASSGHQLAKVSFLKPSRSKDDRSGPRRNGQRQERRHTSGAGAR